MKNIITASVHFSFKGENHSPSITIELDKYLVAGGNFPDLYPLIAKENNHDLYSYEYEMMQAEEIKFSDAKGMVAEFVSDGLLDLQAFQLAWKKNIIFNQLQTIAKDHMQIEDLQQHPELTEVLLQAFQLGQKYSE